MRSGVKVAVIGGAFVLVATGVGYGGYTVLFDGEDGESTSTASAKRKTGPPDATEIDEASKAFLAAWASGDAAAAAQLTNNPVEAQPLLGEFRSAAKVSKAVITPQAPTGARVPFTVRATVRHGKVTKPWSYSSYLQVVRGLTTGKPLVEWAPTLVHPALTKGRTLRTGPVTAPPVTAVDHQGRELIREKFPSLGPMLDALRKKYGKLAGGTPGVELVITSTDPNAADQTLLALSKGTPGKLRTALDADVQAAAEAAVKQHGSAALVAIKPSTGEIRAVANSPAGGYNTAMLGAQAPGSTMKIVTAAMMLDKGIVEGPGSKVECPSTVQWMGRTFENLEGFSLTDSTFKDSFLRSCNTTFIKAVKPLDERDESGTALGATARKYFGIGLEWKTGVASFDGKVPESTGTETAASYIGQGRITMNALTMASVSATVQNGGFRQPVLVPASLDDRQLATAQRMPGGMSSALREMMAATAQHGTGQASMASVPGSKGAKTGSAEVDGQGKSNSWFTAYAGDLAVAAVVQSGGRGGEAAGPAVARVLNAR
ncbi:penicillin-binding transpeptidase domain-containing protein [Streptomyces albipurpureus]|uniref:Penicillin-binding transpeptidase domain-containing protein n=1 Tax=Streptomyces albipurpureus TaxID=2897419 RepID=A0ABT0UN98_9ACTN|nr:penicillin-binding transpeptidase domain-containing protein [Streptomyces sp. CWNU-1]MCM2389988.1 penicillin-binding transpeptidase domain-containing protein [Streptomyces sp. CWNU-1]